MDHIGKRQELYILIIGLCCGVSIFTPKGSSYSPTLTYSINQVKMVISQ